MVRWGAKGYAPLRAASAERRSRTRAMLIASYPSLPFVRVLPVSTRRSSRLPRTALAHQRSLSRSRRARGGGLAWRWQARSAAARSVGGGEVTYERAAARLRGNMLPVRALRRATVRRAAPALEYTARRVGAPRCGERARAMRARAQHAKVWPRRAPSHGPLCAVRAAFPAPPRRAQADASTSTTFLAHRPAGIGRPVRDGQLVVGIPSVLGLGVQDGWGWVATYRGFASRRRPAIDYCQVYTVQHRRGAVPVDVRIGNSIRPSPDPLKTESPGVPRALSAFGRPGRLMYDVFSPASSVPARYQAGAVRRLPEQTVGDIVYKIHALQMPSRRFCSCSLS